MSVLLNAAAKPMYADDFLFAQCLSLYTLPEKSHIFLLPVLY